jgi:hypothetical protein
MTLLLSSFSDASSTDFIREIFIFHLTQIILLLIQRLSFLLRVHISEPDLKKVQRYCRILFVYIFSLILVLVAMQRVLLRVRVHIVKHSPNIIIYMGLRMEFHKQNKQNLNKLTFNKMKQFYGLRLLSSAVLRCIV